MDEATFRTYIGHFNGAEYDKLVAFFADDVTLSFPNGTTLEGREGIVAFYRPIHAAVKEVLEIDYLIVGEGKIAVELYTEFHAEKDFPGFPGRALEAGDVLRFTSFVHYDLDETDRFRRIRVARYREHDESYRAGRSTS
jgi:SnoaL-like domain